MFDDDPRIDPADLRRVRFPSSFRGYDVKAVDDFLRSVAARVEETNALLDRLQFESEGRGAAPGDEASGGLVDRLRVELEGGLEPASPAPEPVVEVSPPAAESPDLSVMDDDDVARLVGEETANVLSTARRAATEIRSKAEESAARVIRESTADAARAVEEAEAEAAELEVAATEAHRLAVEAAESDAAGVRAEAEAEAERVLAEAREEVETLRATVEATKAEAEAEAERIIGEAKDECREMIAEAKELRGRVLEDLQRRRDMGRTQVERLAAGRDQLLAAYAAVRANVDEITAKLDFGVLEVSTEHNPLLEDGFSGIVDTGEHVAVEDGSDDEREARDGDVDPPGAVTDAAVDADRADDEADEPESDEPESEAPAAAEPVVAEPMTEAPAAAEPVADEQAEAESPAEEPVANGESGAPTDVDALFAKIRAERAQSVARAQKVLDAEGASQSDGAHTEDPSPQPEPAPAEEHTADEPERPERAAGVEGAHDRIPAELLADPAVLQARVEALAPIDKKLARALKRHLADEQNLVLDALRRTESTAIDDLLPPAVVHISGYADVARTHLEAAAALAGTAPPGTAVAELATVLGATLVEAFRRRVERSAAEVDGDADVLDERLRALYREWKVEHIGTLTTDALLSAHALGRYASAPDGASLRWMIDPEQGPCPDAQDNALAGPVVKGEQFPTGDLCPQAHPGCRCVVVVEP